MANADVFAAMGKKPMSGMQTTYDEGDLSGEPVGGGAAPAAPAAAPAAPAEVGRFKGSGGYEYAEMSDGTIKITKSPRGGAGTVVKQDSQFFDLIKADIAKFKAPGGTKSASTGTASAKKPAAAPKATVVGVPEEMEAVEYVPAADTSTSDGGMSVEDILLDYQSSDASEEPGQSLVDPREKGATTAAKRATQIIAKDAMGKTRSAKLRDPMNLEARTAFLADATAGFVSNGMDERTARKVVQSLFDAKQDDVLAQFAARKPAQSGPSIRNAR